MPRFNRVSLAGSEELFRPTGPVSEEPDGEEEMVQEVPPADILAGRSPVPRPVAAPVPLTRERAVYRLQLSEGQVKTLIEALQHMKYPHRYKPDTKPSIEEHEALEALRNELLDAIS